MLSAAVGAVCKVSVNRIEKRVRHPAVAYHLGAADAGL